MSVAVSLVLLNNQTTPAMGNEWSRIEFIRVVVHSRSKCLVGLYSAVFSFKFDRILCDGTITQIKPSEPYYGIVRDLAHTDKKLLAVIRDFPANRERPEIT